MIKNWDTPGTTCKDSWGRDCGTFWIFDLDDLEDCHGTLWRIRMAHELKWKTSKLEQLEWWVWTCVNPVAKRYEDVEGRGGMLNFVLQDTVLDGMSSEADYWHFQTWRQNQDVTVVLSGLTEQTEYSYIYCFAEDDEPDGLSPSYPSYPSCLEIRISVNCWFCKLRRCISATEVADM